MPKLAASTFLCLLGLVLLPVAHADTPLELSMKQIAKAFHQLSLDLKAPQDADKPEYLRLADTIKTEAKKGRELVPQKANLLPPDQKIAMIDAYQKSMDDFDKSVDLLIADLQANNWDEANKQLADLKAREDVGHKDFRIDNHKKGPSTPPPAPAADATPAPAMPPPAAPPAQ